MYNTTTEILTKINLIKDSTIEWKEVRVPGDKVNAPARNDLADEIASFANWCDGVILLGVSDKSREIIGIPREKVGVVEQYVRNICNDLIKPVLPFRITAMELPNASGEMKAVLKIDISRSLFVHESPGGYLFRQGSEKRKMTPELLARTFQQRSQSRLIRFDEQIVPETTIDSLAPSLVSRYLREEESAEEGLRKLSFIHPDEHGDIRATVSGILFFTDNPTKWISNAYIDCVAYKGTEKSPSLQIDAKKFSGPLDKQIEDAFHFCVKYNRVSATKTPVREETNQFSEVAIFEAIVNAVAHRDYSIFGSHIRIFMYDDRLEIYSPGGLPNTLTVESIELRQANRNENIVSVLSRIPVPYSSSDLKRRFLMDKRGWGVPVIIEESLKLSGKKPVYQLVDQSELILTIYGADLPS